MTSNDRDYFDLLVALGVYERTGRVQALREATPPERELPDAVLRLIGQTFVARLHKGPGRVAVPWKDNLPLCHAILVAYEAAMRVVKPGRGAGRQRRDKVAAAAVARSEPFRRLKITASGVLRAKAAADAALRDKNGGRNNSR